MVSLQTALVSVLKIGMKHGWVMDYVMMERGVFILTVKNLIMMVVTAVICRPVKIREW